MLTQERLKKLLHYNQNTGEFIWLKTSRIAGCVKPDGYISICIEGKSCSAHRIAFLYMTGRFPLKQVDHIDHNKQNNRWNNLRDVSNQENNKNRTLNKNNTSGVTGVSWEKGSRKWRANITVDRKDMNLGLFLDKFEAICCRKSANNKHGFHENHGV